MRSDDDLLAHVRREAGARKVRRQRAIVGASVMVAVAVLGLAAVAAGNRADREQVQADDGGRPRPTTTLEVDEAPDGTDEEVIAGPTTTSTTPDPGPTTTTAPEPAETTTTTTEPRPIRPYSVTRVGDGITITVEALQDRARPGVVDLNIRIQADRGSAPGGTVSWDDGSGAAPEPFGSAVDGPMDCPDLVDDDPATEVGPDDRAGPLDETITLTHTYDGTGFTIDLATTAYTSFCSTDEARIALSFPVDIGGA